MKSGEFWTAVSIFVGTIIGAGFLGIPFVAARAGFSLAVVNIIAIGLIILFTSLYMGEITLRTKEKRQIPGYGKKYLGKTGAFLLQLSTVFGIYAAIVAYMLGIGESLSFLIFGDGSKTIIFGILTGFILSAMLWRGLKALKTLEKIGVTAVLVILAMIVIIFAKDVETTNLVGYNLMNILLPFGVVFFALQGFSAIPEMRIVMKEKEKDLKGVIVWGVIVSVVFYLIFTFIVVGSQGPSTPQIATLALGTLFVILGIFTMFTSYLSLGNVLMDNLKFDKGYKKRNAWFVSAIIPIGIFLLTQFYDFFSFTKILSLGGTISGGLTAALILLMAKNAKKMGNRKSEYSIPINWFTIIFLWAVFIAAVIVEFV